jgi:hypothetical protein
LKRHKQKLKNNQRLKKQPKPQLMRGKAKM